MVDDYYKYLEHFTRFPVFSDKTADKVYAPQSASSIYMNNASVDYPGYTAPESDTITAMLTSASDAMQDILKYEEEGHS